MWVWWLYGLIGFLLLILAFLLFSTIRVQLTAEKSSESALDVKLVCTVRGRAFDIPVPGEKEGKAGKKEERKDEKKAKKRQADKPGILERLQNGYHLLRELQYTVLKSREAIRKRLVVEMLELDVAFGLSDAAQTGIATGIAWGVLYNIYAQADRFVTVQSHNFCITPSFNSQGYRAAFSVTLKVRLADLIGISIIVACNYLTVHQKYKKAVYERYGK